MRYLSLYFYLQQTVPSLKLPYRILDSAVDWLVTGLVDWRIYEVKTVAVFNNFFPLVDVADSALILVLMELIEDLGVAFLAEAKSAAFFECFLPSSEARADHEIIAEPLEGQR